MGGDGGPAIIRHPATDVGQRPFIVIWEVTRACDLACAHCRAEAIPLRHPQELTAEEGVALIDQVAALGTPPPLFVLTGGDPLKRPDLLEGRCGRCEFASVCGGSRSRAFAMTGDPLAEDPLCAYAPGAFRWPPGSES